MLPTWFLSMWISNTATTAMMIAIVQAVIAQLNAGHSEVSKVESGDNEDKGGDNKTFELKAIESEESEESSPSPSVSEGEPEAKTGGSQWTEISKALSLCVCYAATCGGIATLTGTAPNVILGENAKR